MRSIEIMKRLRKEGAYLEVEHIRTEGGQAIIIAAEDFLFPQYDCRVGELKRRNKAWLQDRAKALIAKYKTAAPEVLARWNSIIDGTFFK